MPGKMRLKCLLVLRLQDEKFKQLTQVMTVYMLKREEEQEYQTVISAEQNVTVYLPYMVLLFPLTIQERMTWGRLLITLSVHPLLMQEVFWPIVQVVNLFLLIQRQR